MSTFENSVLEEARQLMYKLADLYGRGHPIVRAQSEILDELILVEQRRLAA
jgi:hypothetical protein